MSKYGLIKFPLLVFFLLAVVALLLSPLYASSSSKGEWVQIDEGSLKAEMVNNKWYLRSVPTVYLNILGAEGKELKILNSNVLSIDETEERIIANKVNTSKNSITVNSSHEHLVFNSQGVYFDGEKDKSNRFRGGLLLSDPLKENIYLLNDTGIATPLLNSKGLKEAKDLVSSFTNSGENKGRVVWATNEIPISDEKIIFHSNRDTVKDQDYLYSVYLYDASSGDELQMILDHTKYSSDIKVLSATEEKVVAYLHHKRSVLIYNLVNNQEKIIDISGDPVSVSPDGSYVLYRKLIEDFYVDKDLHILNTNTGESEHIGMIDGYFLNTDGSWSPDNSKYAFLLNGEEGNDPINTWYRTNIKLGIVYVERGVIEAFDAPSDKSNLYQRGHVSWMKNKTVLAYTDDNKTWALKLK